MKRKTKVQQRPPDMDRIMLGGCSAFVSVSMVTYFLGIAPFAIQPAGDLGLNRGLFVATGISFLSTLIFGLIATRATGLAGLIGSVGGTLSVGVFFHLLLEHTVKRLRPSTYPPIQWPDHITTTIPIAWVIVIGLLNLLVCKKE